MSLVFNISNARDLFAKLQRSEKRLLDALSTNNEDEIGDALFDFAVTGHSIKDWAKKAAKQQSAVIDVEDFVKSDIYLQACRDIANSSKHQSITQYVATTSRVYASAPAAFSIAGLQGAQPAISESNFVTLKMKVQMTDGLKFEVRQFSTSVVSAWDGLLTRIGV